MNFQSQNRSHILLNSLFNNRLLGVVIISENGEIQDANNYFIEKLEYPKEEIVHKKLIDFFTVKEEKESIENTFNGEQILLKKNGDYIGFTLTIDLIESDNETHYLVLFQRDNKQSTEDNNKKKLELFNTQKESELNKQKIFYETILNNIPSDIAVFSLDHKYLFANLIALADPEKRSWIIGRDDFDYVEKYNKPIAIALERRKNFERVLNLREEFEIEEELTLANGKKKWVVRKMSPVFNENNELIFIIGYGLDITKIKQSETNIKKFMLAIEQSGASMMVTDTEGIIEYVNPTFCKNGGFEKSVIVGKNFKSIQSKINESNVQQTMWDMITLEHTWKGVFSNKRKSGERYYEQAIVSPVFDEKGKKTNYVVVNEDITDRILFEEEKKKLIEELTSSYNELKQFTYITSHNLRAPVTNLMGIMELIDLSLIEDNTTSELINGFKKSTEKLNETLNDLIKTLIIKENTSLDFIRLSFQSLFNKTVQGIEQQIEKAKVEFDVNFDEAPDCVLISSYMESVFQNLITNSIKYAKPNVPAQIKIRSRREDGKTILTYKDNGIGMNLNKVKDRVFGLYQKFHKHSDSKGIGLYLVKSHIQAMKGKIEIQSEVDRGTSFTITFK